MKTYLKNIFLLTMPLVVVACVQPSKETNQNNLTITTTPNQTTHSIDGEQALIIEQEINSNISNKEIQGFITKDSTIVTIPIVNANTSIVQTEKPMKLAVLLPLTGSYKDISLELEKGIMTEYFNLPIKPKKISFYDSNTNEINALYQKLVKQKYTTIIGPITSKQIEKINYSAQVINIPLNKIAQQTANTYAFNFKEHSQNEIKQITDALSQKNYRNVLLITNGNVAGEVFADKLSNQLFYAKKNLRKIIYLSEDITDNAKKTRTFLTQQPKLKKYTYNENGFISITENIKDDFPYIRQDIDAIVLSINAKDARLINALLKTIGGNKLAIYSSSLLTKSNDFNINKEQNLNNIIYLDSTWKYTHKDYNLLSSLITDAIRIALHIPTYQVFIYQGLTGQYTIDKATGMTRQLQWYQIKKNKATPLQNIIN